MDFADQGCVSFVGINRCGGLSGRTSRITQVAGGDRPFDFAPIGHSGASAGSGFPFVLVLVLVLSIAVLLIDFGIVRSCCSATVSARAIRLASRQFVSDVGRGRRSVWSSLPLPSRSTSTGWRLSTSTIRCQNCRILAGARPQEPAMRQPEQNPKLEARNPKQIQMSKFK